MEIVCSVASRGNFTESIRCGNYAVYSVILSGRSLMLDRVKGSDLPLEPVVKCVSGMV
jgi:hypothetical protein